MAGVDLVLGQAVGVLGIAHDGRAGVVLAVAGIEVAGDGSGGARERYQHGVELAGGALGEELGVGCVVEHVVVPSAAGLAVVVDADDALEALALQLGGEAGSTVVATGEEGEVGEVELVCGGSRGDAAGDDAVGPERLHELFSRGARGGGERPLALVRFRPHEVLLVDLDAGRLDDLAARPHRVAALRVAGAAEEGPLPALAREAGLVLMRGRLEHEGAAAEDVQVHDARRASSQPLVGRDVGVCGGGAG